MSNMLNPRRSASKTLTVFIALSMAGVATASFAGGYDQLNLVTDDQTNLVNSGYTPALHVDPSLVNPWGLAAAPTSPMWVSNNGTGSSTLYDGAGTKIPLTVTVPGAPTGQVFGGGNFQLAGQPGNSLFIFASEDGTISQWNVPVTTQAQVAVDNSALNSVYKGLATAKVGDANQLYATDFHNNRIDVFNSTYGSLQNGPGAFIDPNLPKGYAPFGIQNIGGDLFVTYAKQNAEKHDDVAGIGHGFVDVYHPDGSLVQRFASRGTLNSPWGVALAPSTFGEFAGDLLIGNFGDGLINVFNPKTGQFIDHLVDRDGEAIVIDGLWGLAFGNNGANSSPNKLYFSAGINDEAHGLFGVLTPAPVPLPASLSLLLVGILPMFRLLRSRSSRLAAS